MMSNKIVQRSAEEIRQAVEELLNRMTLEEKLGQMTQSVGADIVAIGSTVVKEPVDDLIRAGRIGSMIQVGAPKELASKVRRYQKMAVEESRLGIPLLFSQDVIHGFETVFPIPLGWASSFDMNMIWDAAGTAAKEASICGISYIYSPMVDVVHDPRWGRVAESGGEDPYLGAQIARAIVEGFQGEELGIYCWGEYVPEYTTDWQGFRFIDYYGGEVEVILSTGDYYENLYKLIAAGEIPDIVVGEAKSFPRFIMKDLAQPWDNYIDFDEPVWQETGSKEDIDKMRYDGHVYNLTNRAHNLGVMFYNQRLISEAGLEEPAELQKRGEWTWEKFEEYLDATTMDTTGDGVTDVYGMVNTGDFPTALFASTGELHIQYENGAFVNNMKSQKIQDAANFLYGIGNNGAQYMSLGDPVAEFLNGKAAFVYTNDYRGYVDYASLWETDGIGIVPMPKYSGSDEQYQASLTDHLWLMKGAQNPEGAALMVLAEQYDRLLNVDPKSESSEASQIADFVSRGFTQEAAEAVIEINKMPTQILWSRNITMSDGNVEYRAMDTPWLTLVDTVIGSVDKAIQDATTPE